MEYIYEYMEKTKGISSQELDLFRVFVESEEYETESVIYDVLNGNDGKSSNIFLLTTTSSKSVFYSTLHQYLRYKQGMNIYLMSLFFLCVRLVFFF